MFQSLIHQFGLIGTLLCLALFGLVAAYIVKKLFDTLIGLVVIGGILVVIFLNLGSLGGGAVLPGPLDQLLRVVGIGHSASDDYEQCLQRTIQSATGPQGNAVRQAGQACTVQAVPRRRACYNETMASWRRWAIYDKNTYCMDEDKPALTACEEAAVRLSDDQSLRLQCSQKQQQGIIERILGMLAGKG